MPEDKAKKREYIINLFAARMARKLATTVRAVTAHQEQFTGDAAVDSVKTLAEQ